MKPYVDPVDLLAIDAAARADFVSSKAVRDEFKGRLDRYISYRRCTALGRVRTLVGAKAARVADARELANAAARRGPDIASAAIELWKSEASIRAAFNNVAELAEHMERHKAALADAPTLPPAAA